MTQTLTIKNADRFIGKVTPDSHLGLAILVAESESGEYEPVDVVSTIRESDELAMADFSRRLDDADNQMCPYVYKLWARGINGDKHVIWERKV